MLSAVATTRFCYIPVPICLQALKVDSPQPCVLLKIAHPVPAFPQFLPSKPLLNWCSHSALHHATHTWVLVWALPLMG